MIKTFALFTEGVTDQSVLTNVLHGVFGDQEWQIQVNPVQPMRDATHQRWQAPHAGWELVLEKCCSELLETAAEANDFIVIHLDSDCCSHTNINIRVDEDGGQRDCAQFSKELIDTCIEKIGANRLEALNKPVIFAISVHTIECWILPIYAERDVDRKATLNCENRLRRILSHKRIRMQKEHRAYSNISRELARPQVLQTAMTHSPSLSRFHASCRAAAGL
ncbi:hypothetical protein [Phreatobacter cathodiphilus]|uniref:hypothetical protein n=1 Tax=Phreatobacter cathodiphilus TaxID=1868589 RepID=UPI0011B27C29|nr:hypothetical protein [Phreatobacter cathodiphilus]